jgi:hypothetical protein
MSDDEQPEAPSEPPQKHPGGRPKLHGYRELRDLVRRRVDGRSAVGVALRRFQRDLTDDLGGSPSRAQLAIIQTVSRTWLLLTSLDDWLSRQPSIVNVKKRQLLPIVLQRQTLADSLLRHLAALGLERKPRPVESLEEYIARKAKDVRTPSE